MDEEMKGRKKNEEEATEIEEEISEEEKLKD
jgi:hypothetical protein